MILLMILALILLILLTVLILGVSALGSAVIIIFGDIIVCLVFIVLLIGWIIKKHNK